MIFQERQEYLLVTVANFAQHPTDRFVHQVVRMIQHEFGELNRVGKIALLDVMESRDDRDTITPQVI